VVSNSSGSYTLTGIQLTGVSAGACYGPNATSATNYPIVQLTSTTGAVKYATTTNWSPGVSSPGNAVAHTVNFQMPAGFGVGSYQLVVIANGIPSTPYTFVIPAPTPNFVTMTYNPSTQQISLTGDSGNNNITIAVKNQILTVTGSGLTSVTYGSSTATSQSIHFGTNVSLATSLAITAQLNAGDDYFTVTGVSAKSVNANLGLGNDNAIFTYDVINSVTVTGGGGSDVFGDAASKFSSLSLINIVNSSN
jgi:hypothetical protein